MMNHTDSLSQRANLYNVYLYMLLEIAEEEEKQVEDNALRYAGGVKS